MRPWILDKIINSIAHIAIIYSNETISYEQFNVINRLAYVIKWSNFCFTNICVLASNLLRKSMKVWRV